jgi:hypothetical protein
MKKILLLLMLLSIIISSAVYAQAITITTPNGNENYFNSTNYGIHWSDNLPFTRVKIDLLKAGVYYYTIVDTTESDGYYSWAPNVLESGIDYRVKITSHTNSNDFDFSDGDFSISNNEIIISAPNGGESFINSTNYGVRWTDNIWPGVKIDLYKGNVFSYTIVDTTESDGYYSWAPNAAESGSDYKIKISSVASSNDFDFSDSTFSISKSIITISTPNGAESYFTSTNYGINWTDNIIGGHVKIDLYKGDVFSYTVVDTTESDGYYSWSPNVTESGTDYKIKISSAKSNNDNDFSDANFSITKSSITLSTPNGGEVLLAGAGKGIVWLDNIWPNVKIELFKGGEFYSIIADTTPSNGYYNWEIPLNTAYGNDYKIKISSVASSNDFDFSNGNFSINIPTGIDDIPNQIPDKFALMQNYPNPFNPATKIRYELPEESKVVIKIYNILGSEVMELLNEQKEPGVYEVEFNANNLASGTYIYKISADNFVQTKKMILMK